MVCTHIVGAYLRVDGEPHPREEGRPALSRPILYNTALSTPPPPYSTHDQRYICIYTHEKLANLIAIIVIIVCVIQIACEIVFIL